MPPRTRLLLASMALPLATCGQYLGDYQVERVRIVTDPPPLWEGQRPPYPEYVKILVSSEIDLVALGGRIDAIYVDADFCPMRDSNLITVFGPLSDDGHDLGMPSTAPTLSRNPDGRFRYRLYLVTSHPAPGVRYSQTMLDQPGYNLRTAAGDLCLRLFAPGYNLIPSRSGTIRVPIAQLRAAFEAS